MHWICRKNKKIREIFACDKLHSMSVVESCASVILGVSPEDNGLLQQDGVAKGILRRAKDSKY